MLRSRFLAGALAVTSALALASPAFAQSPYQAPMAPQPTPDADALAASMRRLAENPRDLDALITAGELSLKVGDASGAAALFKRAEGVDPMNGRVKAGMARILVTQERPGEALRYFDQAVGYGLDPRSFAGDRGLAYDLIGEQERAQRDYRLALKSGDNDEVRRRYALSLGIAGKQLQALEQLEPLIRRNDRGAWRARAFILAMTGDVSGANRIAQSMMPGAIGQGLGSFFVVLPTLAPVDRAFAVHFGEVRATPQRIADARLTPALPVLGPDPDARVMVAAAPPPPAPTRNRRDRRRRAAERVEVARAAPQPATPAPGFGRAGESPTDPARRGPAASVAPAPAPVAVAQVPAVRPAPAPVQVAALPPATPGRPRESVDLIQKPTLADYTRAERYNQAIAAQFARARTALPTAAATQPAPAPVQIAASTPPVQSAPVQLAASTPPVQSAPVQVAVAPPPVQPAPAPLAAATPAQTPSAATAAATTTPAQPTGVAPSPPAALAAAPTPTAPHASEDSILSRIVAGLTVPGYELGVGSPPPADPQPAAVVATAPTPVEVAAAQPAPRPAPVAERATVRSAPAPEPVAARPAVRVATRASTRSREAVEPAPSEEEATAPAPRRGRAGARAAPVEVAAAEPRRRGTKVSAREVDDDAAAPTARSSSRRGAKATPREADDDTPATGRRGTNRKALAAKDDTDDTPRRGKAKTAVAAREDKAAKSAKGEPARIWVQVAGGANEGDLPKAWSAVQSRTPALKGKAAYSTPLRATNRVVTGPFKTDAEARAFVNQLSKQGVSAFPFTSDAGQTMKKLPPK